MEIDIAQVDEVRVKQPFQGRHAFGNQIVERHQIFQAGQAGEVGCQIGDVRRQQVGFANEAQTAHQRTDGDDLRLDQFTEGDQSQVDQFVQVHQVARLHETVGGQRVLRDEAGLDEHLGIHVAPVRDRCRGQHSGIEQFGQRDH
ncbi:MAG: hypothetical protein GY708_00610, partial [Actinomycetia bacterium]|nr:hypothetical protein [Actinomycetes bacterium]